MDEETLKLVNKTGDFIHEAWCVDGTTKFIKVQKSILFNKQAAK